MEEKKKKSLFKKEEKAEEKVKAPKAKSSELKDPSGERKILKVFPSELKALVAIGDENFKVVYHRERKTGEWLLAKEGGESIYEKDWIEGKKDLGLLAS
jgi:hypothetical protein